MHDHAELARILSASVPVNWPPESTVDALPFFLSCVESSPNQVGWFGWYAVTTRTDKTPPVLVGGAGFMGPPDDIQGERHLDNSSSGSCPRDPAATW
ncbi:MAG: hypothetical protein WCO86_06000 [Planctomycetota bacterium]